MPRQPRVEYPGAMYHVTVRKSGPAWEAGRELDPEACLFCNDAERERFVDQLGDRVEHHGIRLFAYSLMLSHVHLYLETPKANLGRFMHGLCTSYTVYCNLRRQRHGPLVGRYKAKLVQGDDYHLTLSRYIHLNPVRVAAAARLPAQEKLSILRRHRWSSYPYYTTRRKAPPWLSCEAVLALCGRGSAEQRREYARFVEEALVDGDEGTVALLKGRSLAIGDSGFEDWVREQMIEASRRTRRAEDVEMRAEATFLPASEVLAATADALGVEVGAFRERRRNSPLRGIAAHMLCVYAGLTQREAAGALDIGTGAAVAYQLRSLQSRRRSDRRLHRRLLTLENRLKQAARTH